MHVCAAAIVVAIVGPIGFHLEAGRLQAKDSLLKTAANEAIIRAVEWRRSVTRRHTACVRAAWRLSIVAKSYHLMRTNCCITCPVRVRSNVLR